MSLTLDHKHFLPCLTSREIAELPEKDRAVVVLPVASIEQHGPHLPVYTDSLIADQVLDRALAQLAPDVPVWVLPLLPYGRSVEHGAYAGTVTLSSETLIRVIKEIAASVARSGFKRFVVLNGHGGNTEVIDMVIRDIREQTGLLVFALHIYLRVAVPTEGLSEAERAYGIHAGDAETSILLKCHPDLVKRELAPASLPRHLQTFEQPPFMGPLTIAWLTQDITKTGAIGDATTASPEKGEYFLADAGKQVADLLRQVAQFRFDPS